MANAWQEQRINISSAGVRISEMEDAMVEDFLCSMTSAGKEGIATFACAQLGIYSVRFSFGRGGCALLRINAGATKSAVKSKLATEPELVAKLLDPTCMRFYNLRPSVLEALVAF